MVNTLSHLGIGLLIASVAGLNSRQIKIIAFMAVLPDLDFLLSALLLVIDQSLNHQTYNTLYYLMGHREFMHSLVFVALVILYVFLREKDRTLTIASAAAIFSHIYLDYVTSWKMRPFFPFITDASTIGAIDFFDPVVTIISFVPLFYILKGRAKKNIRQNGQNNWLLFLTSNKHKKLYGHLLIIFTLWCLINPFAKAFLISGIEKGEGIDLDYQDSYPVSPGKFLSAYQYNENYYEIQILSYWSGIEKSRLVRIHHDDEIKSMPYLLRAKKLYEGSLPNEIDYPVYNISSSGENVTVTISDARNSYAQYWAYFKTEYVFVFDTDSEKYHVYVKRNDQPGKTVPISFFE